MTTSGPALNTRATRGLEGSTSATPLRVQIHLNLANPERAENVVRVRSSSGAWVSVAYAKELVLRNAVPIVKRTSQEKIRDGAGKKNPHAFIEGDLVHFKGRMRDKAPTALKVRTALMLNQADDFQDKATQARGADVQVNYNPRFASCFYKDKADRAAIDEKFIGCEEMVVVGWRFLALQADLVPLLAKDRCEVAALARASAFEKVAIGRGRATTDELLSGLATAEPTLPQPRPR